MTSPHITSVLKVLVYVEEHLDEPLELEALAKIANISPYYFHRLFRLYMNETAADYVKRLRLQKASEHLQYSNSPITDIALDIGYETPSSFTKVFHQVMGKSPSHYRKTLLFDLQKVLTRIQSYQKDYPQLEPIYIERNEEKVLFVRYTGDYVASDQAFATLKQFLEENRRNDLKAFYGMPLDDQHLVERSKCRFDACVSLNSYLSAKGLIGEKTIKKGLYAVFTHQGASNPPELENVLDLILRVWHPSLREESLGDAPPFFEFVYCLDNKFAPENDRVTKIYIPLVKKENQ